MEWKINEKYLQTCIPNKWGERLEITIFTIKISQELINLLHKLVAKPLLGIPIKQVFTLFHKLKTW